MLLYAPRLLLIINIAVSATDSSASHMGQQTQFVDRAWVALHAALSNYC